jgi:MFS family permease
MYQVLFNLYLKEIVAEHTIGSVVGLSYLSYAFFSLVAGVLSDRIGPRKTLIAGLILLTGGFVGGTFAESTKYLYGWAILTGLGQASTIAMFVPLLTEYSKKEERMKLFSLAYGSGTFALFMGTLGAGVLADLLSQMYDLPSINSIRMILLLSACFLVLSAIPLLFVKGRSSLPAKDHETSKLKQKDSTKRTFLTIGNFGIIKLLEGCGIGLTIPFINLFLAGRYELNAAMISVVMAVATLGTVFMMFLNPTISKRVGEIKSLIVYQMIGLPSLLLLALTTNLWVATVSFLLFRTMFYTMMPIQSKVMMEQVEDSKKGLTNSIGLMANTIGTGIVSPVSMYLVSRYGNYWGYVCSFVLSSVCIASSVGYFYAVFEYKRKRKENIHLLQKAIG